MKGWLGEAVSSAPIAGNVREEALSRGCPRWPGRSSLRDVSLGDSKALQREEKGLPVGQEGARAPGCGKGCWGSLRGACGWAVLPSCMPASQGHGLQKKTRVFLCICLCILSS